MTVWVNKIQALYNHFKEREEVEKIDIARKIALNEAATLLIEVWPEITQPTLKSSTLRSAAKPMKAYMDKLMWATTKPLFVKLSADSSAVAIMERRNRYLLQIREAFDFSFRLSDRGHIELFFEYIKMKEYLRP